MAIDNSEPESTQPGDTGQAEMQGQNTPKPVKRSTPRNTKGTPARHRHTSAVTAGEPADDNPELIKRREALGNAVWGRLSTEYRFTQFVSKLALRDEYMRYNAIVTGAFSDLAQNAPTITASTITSADGTIKRNIKEKDVSPHFISLYESMEVVAEEKLEGYGGQMYTFVDRQNVPVSGSSLKPDGLFCFADADESFSSAYAAIEMKKDKCVGTPPTQILGQVGDYALSIWKEQPLRMFVPVLLLHGPNLTLFVFTRGTVFQIELGQIGFTSTQRGKKGHSKIESTLTKLWFILSIRPEQFGYACPLSGNGSRLLIGRGDAEHNIALSACEDTISSDAMYLSSRIRKTVHLFGRIAYLYRTNYQRRKVVAKISWSQSDRLPECATYEVLHRDHVSGIPRVCMQGFVKSDFFGYRMELVLLEDCGSPIDESFSNLAQKRDFESATSLLSQYIKGVAKTLVSAYDAGVLHRDVSTGNITVSGTQAYLIDWGYSKFLDWANVDDIAEKWDFKKDEVLKNESAHDHMTGTPLFMSIQTLLESDMRSVIHDIESLFMVALYTLATLNSPSTDVVDAKHGWSFVRNEMTAWLRVGILAGRDGYLKRFGCDKCSDELKVVLDGLYSFLFVENGEFIGGRMIDNKDYERECDLEAASKFLDGPALKCLQNLHSESPGHANTDLQKASSQVGSRVPLLRRSVNEGGRNIASSPGSIAAQPRLRPPTKSGTKKPIRPMAPGSSRAAHHGGSGVPIRGVQRGRPTGTSTQTPIRPTLPNVGGPAHNVGSRIPTRKTQQGQRPTGANTQQPTRPILTNTGKPAHHSNLRTPTLRDRQRPPRTDENNGESILRKRRRVG